MKKLIDSVVLAFQIVLFMLLTLAAVALSVFSEILKTVLENA